MPTILRRNGRISRRISLAFRVRLIALLGCSAALFLLGSPVGCGDESVIDPDASPTGKTSDTDSASRLPHEAAAERASGGLAGQSIGLQLRQRADLPDDFPEDVPIYPGSHPANTTHAADGRRIVVLFGTTDSTDEVNAYFERELPAQGWTMQLSQQTEHGALIKAGKPGVGVSIVTKRVDQGRPSESTLIAVSVGN